MQSVIYHVIKPTLITSIQNMYRGKPILVIGGGPSVKTDLPKLSGVKFFGCVISANQHGCLQDLFPVNFLVNVDKTHCGERVPMQEFLRPYGKPIINKHSWADFRLPDWKFAGNSGLTAVAVAAALGGSPVVVTGIDCWSTGREYFHQQSDKVALRKFRGRVGNSLARRFFGTLDLFCKGAPIRPMSGPLLEQFPKYDPKYDPAVSFHVSGRVPYARALEDMKPVYARATRSFHFSNRDIVPAGTPLALSPTEAKVFQLKGYIQVLDMIEATALGLQPVPNH